MWDIQINKTTKLLWELCAPRSKQHSVPSDWTNFTTVTWPKKKYKTLVRLSSSSD